MHNTNITGIYDELIQLLLDGNVRATKYISPKEIIRATRSRYNGKFVKGNIEIVLTIGRPNWLERQFIKDLIKAKESFPVKKIQLKLPHRRHRTVEAQLKYSQQVSI